MPKHDVGIVGGGPVGLLLACLLAQAGADVAVFDRRHPERSSRSTRAIGIHPPGLLALRDAGLGAALENEVTPINRGSAFCRGALLAELELGASGSVGGGASDQNRIVTLQQQRIEGLLRTRLAELSPGALRSGVVVRSIQEVPAAVVVAADGVHSGIREELDIRWRKRRGEGRYAMFDVPDSEGLAETHPGWVRLFCEPGGIVESFPLPGGYRRWVVCDPGTFDGMTPESLTRIIEHRTGVNLSLASAAAGGKALRGGGSRNEAIHVSTFVARQHVAETLARGNVVLVGDAAHEVSPIGGQGMNLGWIGAMKLKYAILAALRTQVADFRGYERGMLQAAAIAQRRARFNMWAGQPASGAALLMRNMMIRGIGATPLKKAMGRMVMMHGIYPT